MKMADDRVEQAHRPAPDVQGLVEDVEAILWAADPDTLDFHYVSRGAERILGYPISRWLDHPGFWVSILHPEDRDGCVEFCRRQIQLGLDHEFRYRAIAADGSIVWLRDNVKVELGPDGKAAKLHGVMFDVTDRQMRATQQAAASHLGNVAISLPLAEFHDEVVRVLEEALDVDLVEIVEVDPKLDRFLSPVSHTGTLRPKQTAAAHVEVGSWSSFVLVSSGPVVSEDVTTETEFILDTRLRRLGVASAVGAAIGARQGGRYGYIAAYARSRRRFTQDEAHFLASVATTLAAAATRSEVERELKSRENLLATAQEIAGLGSWEWNIESNEVWWSRELFDVHGQDPEAFKPSLKSFLGIVAADDRERVRRIVERSVRTHEPLEYDYAFVRADGTRRIGHALARWMEGREGKLDRLIGTVQDITEVREAELRIRDSEQRFRAIFDHAGLGMATVTPGGRIREANPAFQAMLGYSSEELRNKHFVELTHPDDVVADELLYAELIVGSKDDYSLEKRFIRADGQAVWGLLTATVVRDVAGKATMAVGMVQDITQTKQTLEDLVESREQLSEKSRELLGLTRRLVELQEVERRSIAHDLHDEVGQILTGLKLTLEATPDSAPASTVADRALPLVGDLISLVRDMTLSLRPPMLDDLGLLPTIRWHLSRYEHATDISVRFEHAAIDRRFGPNVETAVYRVVQEALTNIARHARTGSATVRVEADDGRLLVMVEDDGVGFDPARLDASTHGLLGMRERLMSLAGGLSIESRPGEGTRLTAHLPLDPE